MLDHTPGPGTGSEILAALTALGQDLVGANHPATIADRIGRTLEGLLAPDRFLIVLTGAPADERPVTYARNYANSGLDDPLVRLALEGPRCVSRDAVTALTGEGLALIEPLGCWLGAPIRGAAGRTIGAVSLCADQPGRFGPAELDLVKAVLSQAAIALENARLLSLLSEGKREWEQTVDAIGEAFCVVDGTGLVRRANRAFGMLVGRPLTELAGRPWSTLLPEPWVKAVARTLAATGAASAELQADNRLYT
ncbi:MAG: GAF domain-containing protein, partial [Gemmatimonadetes bacterium]|nr:GAF domain-containing protein [Gemmatimonadota bacterium]